MKTKYLKLPFILAIYLCFSCSKDEFIDEEFIDITSTFDSVFAKELQARGYIPDANRIYAKDVADITELDVSGTYDAVGELTSLKGIEYFTSLKRLRCFYNQLTSLDISNNTALTYLYCNSNQLTTLDVSNNTALTLLWCYDNPGDGTQFNVAAWFGNDNIPANFNSPQSWTYSDKTISLNFYIPE